MSASFLRPANAIFVPFKNFFWLVQILGQGFVIPNKAILASFRHGARIFVAFMHTCSLPKQTPKIWANLIFAAFFQRMAGFAFSKYFGAFFGVAGFCHTHAYSNG
jgi:hypothetical protein